MVIFVVDRSLYVLRDEINAVAPNRSKASDGFVGDAAHASRDSQHNPEDTGDSTDGNDPDNQVDAADFTHDPGNGADMHQVAEIIRKRRDRRVLYVIFDGRIFSSYAVNGVPAWTWRPYSGTDKHRGHLHISVNDKYNDTLNAWGVEEEMGMALSEDDLNKIEARVIVGVSKLVDAAVNRTPGTGRNFANDVTDLTRFNYKVITTENPEEPTIPGTPVTLDQLRAIVREELDATRLTGPVTRTTS